jgi:hypothetical protein
MLLHELHHFGSGTVRVALLQAVVSFQSSFRSVIHASSMDLISTWPHWMSSLIQASISSLLASILARISCIICCMLSIFTEWQSKYAIYS